MRLIPVEAVTDYRLRGVLLRREGLLLLVLVCMTTGCAGPKARERAAVTAPSAPKKVTASRVSSPKAKLSAPPRGKARTSVTPVKSAAPPPPAPQQPGEEQEGRVF
jgi:hypothetical protein